MKYFILILGILILCGKSLDAQQRRNLDDSDNRNSFTPRHEMKTGEHRTSFEEPRGRERFEPTPSEMTPVEKDNTEAPPSPQCMNNKKAKVDNTNETFYKPVTVNLDDGERRSTYTYDGSGNLLTVLGEYWENGAWVISSRESYTYDASGNCLTWLYESWENGSWVNKWRESYTYDASGNLLTWLYEFWENGSWVNKWRESYTYDASGNLLTVLHEDWYGGSWEYGQREAYTYDANENLLMRFRENWKNGAWVNSRRYTYTYDANGNCLTDSYELWDYDFVSLVESERHTYTYDTNGNCLTRLFEGWDSVPDLWRSELSTYTYDSNGNMLTWLREYWHNGAWVNYARITYTYDANGNMLAELSENWDNGAWVNSGRSTYTYDDSGNMLTWLGEYWDSGAWVNTSRIAYNFDANGNCTRGEAYDWDGSGWIPDQYGNLYIYYNTGADYLYFYDASTVTVEYTAFSDVNDNVISPATFSVSQNFPNPFNPGTGIKFTIPNADFVTLKVYDILGSEIATLVNEYRNAGSYEVQFNASHLPSGAYFYRLTSGKNSETKKMLLLK